MIVQGERPSVAYNSALALPSKWHIFGVVYWVVRQDVIVSTPARNRAGSNIGTYTLTFDDGEVLQLLKAAVEREGSQLAYAKRHGLDRANMNQILNGKRRVGPTFLKALGLRIVYAKDGNSD